MANNLLCSKDKLCPNSEEYCVYGSNVCMEKNPWCIVSGAVEGPGVRNCKFPVCDLEKYTSGCKSEDYACVKHKSFPASGFCLPNEIKIPGQEGDAMDIHVWLGMQGNDNCNYVCDENDASCTPCPETWDQ